MQRIAQPSEGPKEWVCGRMVHLRIFYAALRESGLLKLPIEMIATIFKHMTESGFVIWVLKIVKDGPPHRHDTLRFGGGRDLAWCR